MRSFSLAITAVLGFVPVLSAQQAPAGQPSTLQVAPSGRASTEVVLTQVRRQGQAPGQPRRIVIDYGQPHARGRRIVGDVVPFDAVWRTGANRATHLMTEVDLSLGGAAVPKGTYTLFTLPTRQGWKLIVSRQTDQWGTGYDPSQDLARIDLRTRTLTEPVESFTMWLVPATGQPPRGILRFAWGDTELSTDWAVTP